MSREIKFRAWHKTLKKLLYEPLSLSSDNLCIDKEGNYAQFLPKKNWRNQDKLYLEANLDWRGNWYENGELQDAVFQQYIGLKDKNGREIYEGGIIHSIIQKNSERGEFNDYEETSVFEVKFIKGQFAGWVYSDYFKEYQFRYHININLTHWSIKKFEVIGNIYENPELLPPQMVEDHASGSEQL